MIKVKHIKNDFWKGHVFISFFTIISTGDFAILEADFQIFTKTKFYSIGTMAALKRARI